MLDLTDIFEEIVYTLNGSAFAEKDFVSHVHEFVLHVFLELCNKLNTVFVEFLEQRRRNIALVSKDFSKYFLDEFGYDIPVPVVDIARSKAKSYDFTFVIDGYVQFEPEEPACLFFV